MRVKKKPILAIIIVVGLVYILKFMSNRHRRVRVHDDFTLRQILLTPVAIQDLPPTSSVQTTQLLTTQPDLEFKPKVQYSDCPTVDWSDPRYCVHLGNRTSMVGQSFNVAADVLKRFQIPLQNFESLQREKLDELVFVTAADDGQYFPVVVDAIASVQRHFQGHIIYFYDLGNDTRQDRILKIQTLCNVRYRKFDFSRYPPYVRYLKNYSFKPLIVQEMLSEFPRIFWMDSSIRWNTDNITLILDEVFTSGGILVFDRSHRNRSNYQTTHPNMYRYIPIPASGASRSVQYGAGSIYIHRNAQIYNRIIVWWVLCALTEGCAVPTLQKKCSFERTGYGKGIWGICHRYDQSSLNLLLANHYQYDVTKYTSQHHRQLEVLRGSAYKENVLVCPKSFAINSSHYFFEAA